MRTFKNVLCWVLMIAGAVTLILYFFTDLMNWNVFGWLSWLLIGIGGWLMTSLDADEGLYKNMICMTMADGKISSEEKHMLISYGQKLGISPKKAGKLLEELIKQASTGEVQLFIPDDEDKKKEHIKTLVEIAKSDGKIKDEELDFIKEIAQKYGLSDSFVANLL